MGKTYRQERRDYDDSPSGRKGKHHTHSNNRKTGGMKIINSDVEIYNDDYFEDDVEITDEITINKTSE